MSTKTSGITSAVVIGYGRFGELLAGLLAAHCPVAVVESDAVKAKSAMAKGYKVVTIPEVEAFDFVFLCVPISLIGQMAEQIASYYRPGQVIIDVCSVKVYPLAQLKQYLPHASIIGTHPMFGPDSAKVGLRGSRLAMCPVSVDDKQIAVLRDFWERHEVEVLETTPEQHDKDAAYSQAFAYIIAKTVNSMKLPDITFRTRSYDWLAEIARLSNNDTDQLFHDIIAYNPYVRDMASRLLAVTDDVEARVKGILSEETQ